MPRNRRGEQGRGALDLLEEATHLLRTAPGSTLALYGIGVLPCLLGFLWYWADMARNPFARQHVLETSLGMAALFVWMKFWQALFARALRAGLAGAETDWNWRACARILGAQTALQPFALLALPATLLVIVPFGWTCHFFQNLTALGADDSGSMRALLRKAGRQAGLWKGQGVGVIAILAAFALFVFLSWAVACAVLPGLLKTLFGVETALSKSPFALLNTTFFMAMACLTYLSVDPLLKAVAVLRCFYGESLQTGADLKASLHEAQLRRAGAVAAILLLWAASGGVVPAAETTPASQPAPAARVKPATVRPADLDQAANEVISQRKFIWRLPREEVTEADTREPGAILQFITKSVKMVGKWLGKVRRWIGEFLRKLFERERHPADRNSSGYGWIMTQQLLLYGLVAAVAIALALLLFRVWRERGRRAAAVTAGVLQPVPDLADENVGADQLPEDGWTRLAHELLARGELRLALRAFYLGSLAHLADRNLITLARFKSNRDYERELRRRAHAFAELRDLFGENVSVFDRIWYGLHEVNEERVARFAANVERIKLAT